MQVWFVKGKCYSDIRGDPKDVQLHGVNDWISAEAISANLKILLCLRIKFMYHGTFTTHLGIYKNKFTKLVTLHLPINGSYIQQVSYLR